MYFAIITFCHIILGTIFYQYMVVFLFNTVIYVFLLLGLCILIVRLPWLRFFRAFCSVVRQMPGYNSPTRGTARTLSEFLKRLVLLQMVGYSMYIILVVLKLFL